MSGNFSSIKYSWLTKNLAELSEQVAKSMATLPYAVQKDGDEMGCVSISSSMVKDAQHHVIANWEQPYSAQLSTEMPDTLRLNRQFELPQIDQLITWLETLSFDVCIGGSLYADWEGKESGGVLFPGQYPLGWLLALKGDGHNYLVSQRWINQAPVKVYSTAQLTLIQLHDVNADSSTALTQAKQAWQFFNRQDTSGFLAGHTYNKTRFNGQYNPDDGGLYVTVLGREPDFMELKDACYCKNFLQIQDGRPINKIVYLFFDAGVAKKWLPELWIRSIECRTFIDGKEVILSDSYVPPQTKNLLW